MLYTTNYLLSAPFINAYSQSDFFGKMIFWSLFFLSVISWVVMIHKMRLTRKLKRESLHFENFFAKNKQTLLRLKLEKMTSIAHPYFSIFSTLKEKTLEILNKNRFFIENLSHEEKEIYLSPEDIELIGSHMEATIAQQAKKLDKNLFVLSTIVTLAPFLGLLGTVWGILLTFSNLQTHSLSSGNSAVLSGLSMALATTVVGLIVAIPALVAYNYLKSSVKDLTGDMENFSHRLLTTVEIQYRKVDVT